MLQECGIADPLIHLFMLIYYCILQHDRGAKHFSTNEFLWLIGKLQSGGVSKRNQFLRKVYQLLKITNLF